MSNDYVMDLGGDLIVLVSEVVAVERDTDGTAIVTLKDDVKRRSKRPYSSVLTDWCQLLNIANRRAR